MEINEKRFILKQLGIKILDKNPINSDLKLLGSINGFFIYPQSYYWVLSGKMPFKFARQLYDNKLGIRTGGCTSDTNPEFWCTSEEYEEYILEQQDLLRKDLISSKEFASRLMNKQSELLKNNEDDMYIDMYHIDTLEGLKEIINIIKDNNLKTEW